MKRQPENELEQLSPAKLPNTDLTAQVGAGYQIKDFVEELVISEILPWIDVLSQLCLAATSKAYYHHFLPLILQNSSQPNRDYLQRWIQHLAYEGDLLNRINQSKLKLKHYTSDTLTLTALIFICQFLLSDRRDTVLFNKVLLLTYHEITRIEVVRCLTPYFMSPLERFEYIDQRLAGVKNGELRKNHYSSKINAVNDLIAMTAWLEDLDKKAHILRAVNETANNVAAHRYGLVFPAYLISWKDTFFDRYDKSLLKLLDDPSYLTHRYISYLIDEFKGFRCYLSRTQAELLYSHWQRVFVSCYLHYMFYIEQNETLKNQVEASLILMSTEITKIGNFLGRRFNVTAKFELDYTSHVSNLKLIAVPNKDPDVFNNTEVVSAMLILVGLYNNSISRSKDFNRVNFCSAITGYLMRNSLLISQMNDLISVVKENISTIRISRETDKELGGQDDSAYQAVYEAISGCLETMSDAYLVDILLVTFFDEITSLSRSVDLSERMCGYGLLLKLGRVAKEEINAIVLDIIEIFNTVPVDSPHVDWKLVIESIFILVKDFQIESAQIQDLITILQNTRKSSTIVTGIDFNLCLVEICHYASISSSQKNEILVDIWNSDNVSSHSREKVFAHLLRDAPMDVVRSVMDNNKNDEILGFMKKRLFSKDGPDAQLNNAMRI